MTDDHIQTTVKTYDKTAEEFIVKVQKYAPEPEREKFILLVKPGGKILDAGCGSGRDANYFASKGFIVTGIDLSDTLLSYARETAHPNARFQKMDLRTIRLDETFDGIWTCASLLHLKREEFLPVLRNFQHVLMPGGVLFLLMKEGTGEKLITSGTIEGDTRFFTYYTTEEIRALLETAGFTVTDINTWDQKDRHGERPHEVWISTFATRKRQQLPLLPKKIERA